MIYEYAIEPELVVEWGKDRAEYRYFYKEFGIGTSRMMGEYPKLKNWRKQLREAAANADQTNELPMITALFSLLKERMIYREGYNYDGTSSWLKNAESEHNRKEFQAILARDNPRNNQRILTPYILDASPLWNVEKQVFCSRTAVDMGKLLSAMLSNCSEIHFIDPYFGAENVRFRRPFERFFDIIAASRDFRPSIKSITIHTANNNDRVPLDFFKESCEIHLKPKTPAGITIRLQRWKHRNGGEILHERYVLTDVGGIKVGPGLDDGRIGQNFEAVLLERNLFEKQWSDYVTNPAFDPSEDPFEIIGIKGM